MGSIYTCKGDGQLLEAIKLAALGMQHFVIENFGFIC